MDTFQMRPAVKMTVADLPTNNRSFKELENVVSGAVYDHPMEAEMMLDVLSAMQQRNRIDVPTSEGLIYRFVKEHSPTLDMLVNAFSIVFDKMDPDQLICALNLLKQNNLLGYCESSHEFFSLPPCH